jgi:hypothetical protein
MNKQHYYIIESTEDRKHWESYVHTWGVGQENYSSADEAFTKAEAYAASAPPYIKEFRVMKHIVTTAVQYCGSFECNHREVPDQYCVVVD